jgi:hypothetical protein
MIQRCATLAVATVTLLLLTASAHAQITKNLVGTWMLASNTAQRDGKTIDNFGPNPKGTLILNSNGRFAVIVMRSDLPKFASSRENATADESMAVVKGSLAYFGTYTVNEAENTMTYHIESSTYPNWQGESQKRQITLSGDKLQIANALTASTIIWQRAK